MDIKEIANTSKLEKRIYGYLKNTKPNKCSVWDEDGQFWIETNEHFIKRKQEFNKEQALINEFTCTKENISNLNMYLESGVEYEVYIKKATV